MIPTLRLKRPKDPAKPQRPKPNEVVRVDSPLFDHFFLISESDVTRPKRRHSTPKLARAEAERLKLLAPERRFLVYEGRRVVL
jgi:hypothetical protein